MKKFTEIGKHHNSFLAKSAMNQKILVIVPHEDDEINVAGSVMYMYAQKGAEVYCVFTTNGDYSFAAATRMREAEKSLHTLGVTNIFFLGYGDTSNHYSGGHLFYHENDAVTSPAGHRETYGASHFVDYAFQTHKAHSPYCRAAMRLDLESLILHLKADIIFCVDLDVHADHRAASIIFEEAMGNILKREGNTYTPIVFKGFAYCTSFGAPKDFYERNIRSVPLPEPKDDSIIGISFYEWKSRVRIPVLPDCRGYFLHDNILYRALFAHASQSAALHTIRIANGDAVFWQRRTDNLIYRAKVEASSGNPYGLTEFKILDLNDIDKSAPSFATHSWCPASDDPKKELYISWPNAQNIDSLQIAGSIDSASQIRHINIFLDNGSVYKLENLPIKGHIMSFKFPESQCVSSVCLNFNENKDAGCGISFIGFFAHEKETSVINPYIKILVNDDFAYDYLLPSDTDVCQLSIYKYNTNGEIKLSALNDTEGWVDEKGIAHFAPKSSALHIRAELEHCPDCYDEICLHRVNHHILKKLDLYQYMENKLLTFYLKKYRKYTHIRHKYFKKL